MSWWKWAGGAVVLLMLAGYLAYRRTLRATVAREEGSVPYIYRDSAGIETFGIGHKVLPTDQDLRQWSKANPAPSGTVNRYFDQDIARAEAAVTATGAQLSGNQRAALASLVFNIGVGAFEKSTLRRLLIAGDFDGAAAEFPKWKNAGGKPVLLARREREAALFVG